MVIGETDLSVLHFHRFKETVAVSERTIIRQDQWFSGFTDLTVVKKKIGFLHICKDTSADSFHTGTLFSLILTPYAIIVAVNKF